MPRGIRRWSLTPFPSPPRGEGELFFLARDLEPRLRQRLVFEAFALPAPDGLGEAVDGVEREAERLADFADRAAPAIADDGGGEAGAVAAVFLVDVLDDLLAPLVLEIDVDVGRLLPLGADEALEQEIDAAGIDRGDAKHVADGRVRRRAAALAEDAARLGLAHDVVDGEEVGRVIELRDQGQLVRDEGLHFLGHAARIAFFGADPGEAFQFLLPRAPFGHRLDRIFVAQLVEREADARGDLDAARDGFGMIAEQPRHLGRRFQMPLGIGEQAEPGLVERHMLADAGEHVLERPALGRVVVHVVGGDERQPARFAQARECREPHAVIAAIKALRGEISAVGEEAGEGCEEGLIFPLTRHPDRSTSFATWRRVCGVEGSRRSCPAIPPLRVRAVGAAAPVGMTLC